MTIEADAPRLIHRTGGWLAKIVKEDREDERERGIRGQQCEHEARVDKDITLGVEFRRLIAALELVHFR